MTSKTQRLMANLDWPNDPEAKNALTQLIMYTLDLEMACENFVERVEKGEIRSFKTYSQFIKILDNG